MKLVLGIPFANKEPPQKPCGGRKGIFRLPDKRVPACRTRRHRSELESPEPEKPYNSPPSGFPEVFPLL
jgi:hypothetical protein